MSADVKVGTSTVSTAGHPASGSSGDGAATASSQLKVPHAPEQWGNGPHVGTPQNPLTPYLPTPGSGGTAADQKSLSASAHTAAPARYLWFASTWTTSDDTAGLTVVAPRGTPKAAHAAAPANERLLHAAKQDADAVDAHFRSINFAADAGSIVKAKIAKKELVNSISAFLNTDAPLHVLCWFGHATSGTGDWCLEDGQTFSLAELLQLWRDSRSNGGNIGHLFVLLDCCSAGSWVDAARSDAGTELPSAFTLQASVSGDKKADAGVFTRNYWLPFITGRRSAETTLDLYRQRKPINEESGCVPSAYSTLGPTITPLVTREHLCPLEESQLIAATATAAAAAAATATATATATAAAAAGPSTPKHRWGPAVCTLFNPPPYHATASKS